jgi:hypothetical protein
MGLRDRQRLCLMVLGCARARPQSGIATMKQFSAGRPVRVSSGYSFTAVNAVGVPDRLIVPCIVPSAEMAAR